MLSERARVVLPFKHLLRTSEKLDMDVAEYRKATRRNAILGFGTTVLAVFYGIFAFDELRFKLLVVGVLAIEAGYTTLALPICSDDPLRIDYDSPRIPWLIATQALIAAVAILGAFVWSPAFALVGAPAVALIVALKLKLNPKAARDVT